MINTFFHQLNIIGLQIKQTSIAKKKKLIKKYYYNKNEEKIQNKEYINGIIILITVRASVS